ncbi:hypothetical protein CQ14_38395 [Bradyrhizobium lablabi]|uniref:Uncharacterized protein n=1 Tax=Bradyrhizobium lablabi TaxID=722472 RepID=A0A0R3N7W0_9BRAD|nr:hypothetical protein CQ14_38395 [Bradyrhizobium lablabi]
MAPSLSLHETHARQLLFLAQNQNSVAAKPLTSTAKPEPDCYYHAGIRGKLEDADDEPFLRVALRD